ncbi:MAG: helix-turn-helix transcriptional regulator [Thermoleophilaceae bacterium]
MKLNDMQTFDEVLAEDLKDPEFRARWERTALARAVANRVIAYRAAHELSQSDLARRLGMKQPQVARLEAAEHNPSIETLVNLVGVLDIELAINIHPAKKSPKLVNKRARTTAALSTTASGDTELLIAAVAA